MALGRRHSISTFVIKFIWILFLVFQESNLVICDSLEDDSLTKALQAIERRMRDLEFQDNDYYGQPENIGYGFQKTLGFFDSAGPAAELGSPDSNPNTDNNLQNLLLSYAKDEGDYTDLDKRKTNFRERMSGPGRNYLINQRDGDEDYSSQATGAEYLQLLKNLWSKYRQSRPDDLGLEDLTDDQVEEILNSLYEKSNTESGFPTDYDEPNGYESLEVIPVRSRKNYRIFDDISDWKSPYAKRNLHSQNINYQSPPENNFLYSLKYVNPEFNREAVENLREEGFQVLGDEKDKDIMRILDSGKTHGKYPEEEEEEEEEPLWGREDNGFEEEDAWLPGPVTFSEDDYGRNEKRGELTSRVFKPHNGIHLNAKRFPVKRSPVRVRKEVRSEKVSKEVKGIFATPQTTTVPPKKTTTKKPTEMGKKNATKPEVTKHHEEKKVVRRSDKYTKEEVFPVSRKEEIASIFSVDKKSKKSIDWSQYFGLDKRSGAAWLKADSLRRAEGHLMGPKSKRRPGSGPQYEIPFDTRKFYRKRYSYDIGANIDKVEDKIGDIEERLIDNAVKYTGAHSTGGKENLNQVKSKVIQRLEAAYSLEKMRNALEEFKSLMKPSKNLETVKKTSTESPRAEAGTTVPKESPNLEKPLPDKKLGAEVSKRIAMKKEGVKSMFRQEPSESLEFLNDFYRNKQYENEACPVLDKILHNCLRVEEMGGRYSELLIPLCSLQQICYFCGPEIGFSKISTCDAVYLTEARNICQGESECLVNARNSMLALQDLYEQDLLSGNGRRSPSDSCLANPCIQRYFLNAPGAIYPVEMKK